MSAVPLDTSRLVATKTARTGQQGVTIEVSTGDGRFIARLEVTRWVSFVGVDMHEGEHIAADLIIKHINGETT